MQLVKAEQQETEAGNQIIYCYMLRINRDVHEGKQHEQRSNKAHLNPHVLAVKRTAGLKIPACSEARRGRERGI